jgi:hypothetical protein
VIADEGEDESEGYSNFGQEPGFVPAQPQPYVRDTQPPYQRDQQQPREHRPQPQYQPQPQPQPMIADTGGVDRLPSFITGPQPQITAGSAGYEGGGGGERFPRRRRRPHGPRPEGLAQPQVTAPSGDINSGD